MKKILALVAALTLVIGIGAGVKKATEEAGNPPVGAFAPTEEVALDGITTYGNPPVGG